MALLTARSSTIFIATGDQTRVYHSVEEIPPSLRRKLHETTCGINSATILIADKRGREELVRALQARPGTLPSPITKTLQPESAAQAKVAGKWLNLRSVRNWLELLLPIVIGASLLFFVEARF